MKMEISLKNNQSHAVDIDGQSVTMYTPVMAVGGMVLPEETFQNIQVENGALLSDGAKQAAVFVSLPGLDESLGLSDLDIPDMEPFPSRKPSPSPPTAPISSWAT